MQRGPLVRITVLCNLLVDALEGLETGDFASVELIEQLRDLGSRAAEELE